MRYREEKNKENYMKNMPDKNCNVERTKRDKAYEVLQKVDSPKTIDSNERDAALWTRIRKGETQALGELYDHYIEILFPYGITLCSNKELVMDSIHDLFVDLFKYRKKLADNPQVKYYLLISLKRKIYKKASKKDAAFDKLEESNFFTIDFFESSAEKKLIDTEIDLDQKRRLNRALADLPKKQKMAVRLKFYEDKSYEEIAELMNVTIETSRTLIYRSMVTLRQILSKTSMILVISSFLT